MSKYTTEELYKRFNIIQSPDQPGPEYKKVTDEHLHELAEWDDEYEERWEKNRKILNDMIDEEGLREEYENLRNNSEE